MNVRLFRLQEFPHHSVRQMVGNRGRLGIQQCIQKRCLGLIPYRSVSPSGPIGSGRRPLQEFRKNKPARSLELRLNGGICRMPDKGTLSLSSLSGTLSLLPGALAQYAFLAGVCESADQLTGDNLLFAISRVTIIGDNTGIPGRCLDNMGVGDFSLPFRRASKVPIPFQALLGPGGASLAFPFPCSVKKKKRDKGRLQCLKGSCCSINGYCS